jgi:haloalkane dehalogenase
VHEHDRVATALVDVRHPAAQDRGEPHVVVPVAQRDPPRGRPGARHRGGLIGAGDSDKLSDSGPGAYGFATHARYLDALLEHLDLGDGVVLVGHDWGANLAFDWAMRHAERVRGLAFSEALLPPFAWDDRPEEARRPTLDWPREMPFGDDRSATREACEAQDAWLASSDVPKLHLAAVPGGIDRVGGRRRERIGTYRNLTRRELSGVHWTPEDDPHGLGAALAGWLRELRP